MAALNQYIYVVGGYDGSQQLASVERYDTERDVWQQAAPIRVARSALSLTVLDNKLYAMGELVHIGMKHLTRLCRHFPIVALSLSLCRQSLPTPNILTYLEDFAGPKCRLLNLSHNNVYLQVDIINLLSS